jgi:hypothetical protein
MHPPPIPPEPHLLERGLAGIPNADEEHLRQLAIGHYVYTVIHGVSVLAGLFLAGLGSAMAFRPQWFEGQPDPLPPFLGGLLIAIGVLVTIVSVVWTVCTILAARYLQQRKHYTFCLVVAGFNCMSIPLGTILGVFTFIVLTRPRVKTMFGEAY